MAKSTGSLRHWPKSKAGARWPRIGHGAVALPTCEDPRHSRRGGRRGYRTGPGQCAIPWCKKVGIAEEPTGLPPALRRASAAAAARWAGVGGPPNTPNGSCTGGRAIEARSQPSPSTPAIWLQCPLLFTAAIPRNNTAVSYNTNSTISTLWSVYNLSCYYTGYFEKLSNSVPPPSLLQLQLGCGYESMCRS